jgi:hypothetical protein
MGCLQSCGLCLLQCQRGNWRACKAMPVAASSHRVNPEPCADSVCVCCYRLCVFPCSYSCMRGGRCCWMCWLGMKRAQGCCKAEQVSTGTVQHGSFLQASLLCLLHSSMCL